MNESTLWDAAKALAVEVGIPLSAAVQYLRDNSQQISESDAASLLSGSMSDNPMGELYNASSAAALGGSGLVSLVAEGLRSAGLYDQPSVIEGVPATRPELEDIPYTWEWNMRQVGADPYAPESLVGGMLDPAGMADMAIFAGVRSLKNFPNTAVMTSHGPKTGFQLANDYARANILDSKGIDPWDETGWYKGADGKWRYEIDDSSAGFQPTKWSSFDRPHDVKYAPLSSALKHDDLYTVYPDIANTKLINNPHISARAQYLQPEPKYGVDERIQVNRDADKEFTSLARNLEEMDNPDNPYSTMNQAIRDFRDGDFNTLEEAIADTQKYRDELRDRLENLRLGQMWGSPTRELHEITHGIQYREGFARGGSPEMFDQGETAILARDALSWRKEIKSAMKETGVVDLHDLDRIVAEKYNAAGIGDWIPSRDAREVAIDFENNPSDQLQEFVSRYRLDKSASLESPHNLYMSLAGEEEARAVQKRRHLSPEQRKKKHPSKSMDTPLDFQIVTYK